MALYTAAPTRASQQPTTPSPTSLYRSPSAQQQPYGQQSSNQTLLPSSWGVPSTPQPPPLPSLEQLLGLQMAYAAPGMLQTHLANQTLQSQLGSQGASADLERAGLRNQYGFDQAYLNLQNQGLGFDRQLIGINSNVPQLQDQLANLRALIAYQTLQGGFAKKGAGLERQLLGLDTREIGLGEERARHQAGMDTRSLYSQATAAGSVNLPGTSQGLGDIQTQLANQLAGLGVERGRVGVRGKQVGLGLEKELAGLGYEKGTAKRGVTSTKRDIGLERQRNQIANYKLDLEANRLGIQGDELRNGLELGLKRIGIQGEDASNRILAEMASNDLERAAMAAQVFQQAVGMWYGTGGPVR